MEWTKKLTRLSEIISGFYPTQDEMPRLITIAGLSLQKIKFQGKGEDIWHDIITGALNRGTFNALVEQCIKEHPDNKDLLAAYEDYLKDPRPRSSASETPTDDYIRLPTQPRLIGRHKEIKQFTDALRQPEVRLLTLTGPSGVGKTALAKYLTVSLAKEFADSAIFVELASLSDHSSLESEIGNAMPDYKKTVGVSPINFLREKQRLIVLDNFDSIMSAAPLVTKIIDECPQVKVIATSQEPLESGDGNLSLLEQRRVVAPLSYPGSGSPGATVTFKESGAVQLFIARVDAIKGKDGLALTAANIKAIVGICQEVNGLPLCIQIVASFISTFPPPQLLQFLRQEGFAQLDEKQQLNKAIEIRYDKLKPAEQTLFRRLAIFAGWCSFEAVMEICGAIKPPIGVITTLRGLVDKSLVQSESERYQMLEVIRDYARQQLDATSEGALLRVKYSEYYLELAQKAAPQLKTPNRKEHLYRLEQDYDNFRAVFDSSIEAGGNLETGLSLAGALFWYWDFLAYFREGQQQVRRLLDVATSRPPSPALAGALFCEGGLTFLLGEYPEAQKQLTESVNVWRTIGDKSGLAYALIILGMVKKEIGDDLDAARTHEEESVEIMESLADDWGHALALNDLGNVMLAQCHYEEARTSYEESKRKWEHLNEAWGLSLTLSNLSSLECREHRYDKALSLMEDAFKIQEREKDKWGLAWSLKGIGEARLGLRDHVGAASNFYQSFSLHSDLGRKQVMAECLEGLAKVTAAIGEAERGAYLIGAAEKLRSEAGTINYYTNDKDYYILLNKLRSVLSAKAFKQAKANGRAVSEEQLGQHLQSVSWIQTPRVTNHD
jgi:predicted ATPase